MKNSLILIYLVFTGFISFGNYVTIDKGNQSNFKYQNFKYNSSSYDFVSILPAGKQNHKLNNHEISKSGKAYIIDAAKINKSITFPAHKIFYFKHSIALRHINFYHIDRFLPIITQIDKTIQSKFLII